MVIRISFENNDISTISGEGLCHIKQSPFYKNNFYKNARFKLNQYVFISSLRENNMIKYKSFTNDMKNNTKGGCYICQTLKSQCFHIFYETKTCNNHILPICHHQKFLPKNSVLETRSVELRL